MQMTRSEKLELVLSNSTCFMRQSISSSHETESHKYVVIDIKTEMKNDFLS